MRYLVTAPVIAETAVAGGRAEIDIPAGSVLPDDVPAETVARLLAAGTVVSIADPITVAANPARPKPPRKSAKK